MTAPSHSVTHYPSTSTEILSLSRGSRVLFFSLGSRVILNSKSERERESSKEIPFSHLVLLISISSQKPKMQKRRKPLKMASFLLPSITLPLLLFFFFSLSTVVTTTSVSKNPLLPSEAQALLSFKLSADLQNTLHFPVNKKHCQWVGVECFQGRVFRLILKGYSMEGGTFMANTLTRLDQLRVLSLQNNSLTGPIPDLSGLVNLKTLFLDHNSFSGFFPPSISSLHRLRTLDLSYNNLTGSIPANVTGLDRVYYFKLEWNHFNGELPPLNQSSLEIFNVSGNNLTGGVPITVALSQFDASAFSWNPGLCGKIIHRDCNLPFFSSSSSSPVSPPLPSELQQSQHSSGMSFPQQTTYDKHRKPILILGFSLGSVILIGFLLGFLIVIKKRRKKQRVSNPPSIAYDPDAIAAAAVMGVEEENELEEKVKKMQRIQLGKSGSLMFCAGEVQIYSLEQLMRASAELIGRGSIGSTYKAVLDNQLIVSVKRLDAGKTSKTSKEMFENHMESVGSLRHPNLVPVRAYFQAKEEKLIIYDYQPNGSLFSLIHGSRSTKTKPLHWTSCLKIAEDVAQGLAYIHQASRLVHGNLKSTNVLLGPDFEACLTDYCLTALADSITDMDSNSSEYRAPEIRKSNFPTITSKSDVYSFGILLLELLTGKPASELRLMPTDLSNWRELEGDEENRLSMLLELATTCSQASPEQRPTMWEVMKMIQEIKECVVMEDNQLNSSYTGYS